MSDKLAAVLDDIEEFLEDQQDVRDGSDGEPQPNKAMSLLAELQDARSTPAPSVDDARDAALEEAARLSFPAVSSEEWKRLVELSREEGRIAGRNEALEARLSSTAAPNDGTAHIDHPLRHFDRTCLACWQELDGTPAPQPAIGAPWISVKDRMPPLNEDVLVWDGGSMASASRYETRKSQGWKYPGEDYIADAYGSSITYWMPQPAAPTDEGSAKG